MRKIKFENGCYFHIFNRGVDQRDVFMDKFDFIRFIRSMREFNNNSTDPQRDYEKRTKKKLSFGYPKLSFLEMSNFVDFVCYCLNKNHYHFLLKQKEEKGIEKFMHKLGLGYTKYFNYRYDRSGSLFESTFRAIQIISEDQLLQISCYINGNPEVHRTCKAERWAWSSCQDYLNLRNGTLCEKNIILNYFNSIQEYKKLTDYIIKESQNLKSELKECMLE